MSYARKSTLEEGTPSAKVSIRGGMACLRNSKSTIVTEMAYERGKSSRR